MLLINTNMELPKTCDDCPFVAISDDCKDYEVQCLITGKHADSVDLKFFHCPLIDLGEDGDDILKLNARNIRLKKRLDVFRAFKEDIKNILDTFGNSKQPTTMEMYFDSCIKAVEDIDKREV